MRLHCCWRTLFVALAVTSAISAPVVKLGATEVRGTTYSIVVRDIESSTPQRQLRSSRVQTPQTGGILRLIDARTRREIARANWDAQLNGYFFQLPTAGVRLAQPICLSLVDRYNRFVPVRAMQGNDPGTSFAHPRWDDLLGRSRELSGLKAEQATLQGRRQQAAAELQRLQAEATAVGAVAAGSCPLPPAPPPPVRPVEVMEAAQAQQVSGPWCALQWEQALGRLPQLGRLFAEAGLSSEWEARSSASELAARVPGLKLHLSKGDAALIQDAAVKGSTFLQHADGIRQLIATQDQCRRTVVATAEQARATWEQAVAAAETQPERERQRCEARIARIALLKQADTQAEAYAAELDRQVNDLLRPLSSVDPEPIGHQVCQL